MKKTLPKEKKPKIGSTLSLARYLDLSEWTVSRAINGHPEVKAETRARILAAMGELGFRPNPVARGLNGKAMGIVGVCFGSTYNAAMIDKITLLDKFLREHDLRAMLAISPKDEASELRIIEDFKHLRVDGIVLVQSFLSEAQLHDTLLGVRCVHVDPSDRLLPSVSVDRPAAMSAIVDHLVELGHRSFVVLGFSARNRWRWSGVVSRLRELGFDPEEVVQTYELESPGLESYGEGIELATRALASKKRATAWITVNDGVAAGAMQKMRDEGYEVPRDFSVVGFDNLTMSQYIRPTITTIDQRPQMLIAEAGKLLLEQLGKAPVDGEAERALRVEPLLIIRESTGPAPRRAVGKKR